MQGAGSPLASASWPDALRSPACYRTPTPDLLARLGRVRADWRGGGPAPADGRPRPPVPFARGARYMLPGHTQFAMATQARTRPPLYLRL